FGGPGLAVVHAAVGRDPAERPFAATERRVELVLADPERGRHDGEAGGLRSDPGDKVPGHPAVGRARTKRTPFLAVLLAHRDEDKGVVFAVDDVVGAGRRAFGAKIRDGEGPFPRLPP